MYVVTKEVYFCYGHRLMHHAGKCRHIHGHSVKAAISIAAESLNDQGMVRDFADVAEAANRFIDSHLDHNFLLHKDDPLVPLLEANRERHMTLSQHPTAEFIAYLIHQELQTQGIPVQSVALWETSSSCAVYGNV